jgi:hypothetical protein
MLNYVMFLIRAKTIAIFYYKFLKLIKKANRKIKLIQLTLEKAFYNLP